MMSPPGRPYLRHWWTSARKPSRQHPPTLFSPTPSCAGVCSNGFDSLNRQHRLQPRPRLDEVAQGITLKHLDEGIARAFQGFAQHTIRQNLARALTGSKHVAMAMSGSVRRTTSPSLIALAEFARRKPPCCPQSLRIPTCSRTVPGCSSR
jgi:hypothetical protein